jgi:hypothetical protein
MSFDCKECKESFGSLKSLHAHIKKHGMILGDYYVKHFARRNKLSGDLLQFKNYEDYFEKDFSNYKQLIEWCETAPANEVEPYIISCLKNRIKKKELKYGPNTIELFTSNLPTIQLYKKFFGSYSNACEACGVEPMFNANLPKSFHSDFRDIKIYVDTREQQPLEFKNSEKLKLDVGDYAVGGEDYNYTYVDRKSFGDFCSTMTVDYKRFRRELQRCRDLGCYLFIVTESNLYKMAERNAYSPKRYNLDYAFHNMREIQSDFRDCCQFVFSGNRSNSQILIPKLLVNGKKLWNTDIQYFLDAGAMNYYERNSK